MLSWTPSLPDLLEKEVILQITVTNSLQGQKNSEVKPLDHMIIQPSFTVLLSTQCLCSCQVWKSSSSPLPRRGKRRPLLWKGNAWMLCMANCGALYPFHIHNRFYPVRRTLPCWTNCFSIGVSHVGALRPRCSISLYL